MTSLAVNWGFFFIILNLLGEKEPFASVLLPDSVTMSLFLLSLLSLLSHHSQAILREGLREHWIQIDREKVGMALPLRARSLQKHLRHKEVMEQPQRALLFATYIMKSQSSVLLCPCKIALRLILKLVSSMFMEMKSRSSLFKESNYCIKSSI